MISILPPAYSVPNIYILPIYIPNISPTYILPYILPYSLVGVFIQSLFIMVLCETDDVVLFANALLHQMHYFQYILRK